jgi:Zn-dependent peptidase ImmA (M78 family)
LHFLEQKNIRLFSLLLAPRKIRKRATTRHFDFGSIIYYNPDFEEKQIRILIAHELGHIINKYLIDIQDNENTANLFAFIAIRDKDEFYKHKCKELVFDSDIQILNEIKSICDLYSHRNNES